MNRKDRLLVSCLHYERIFIAKETKMPPDIHLDILNFQNSNGSFDMDMKQNITYGEMDRDHDTEIRFTALAMIGIALFIVIGLSVALIWKRKERQPVKHSKTNGISMNNIPKTNIPNRVDMHNDESFSSMNNISKARGFSVMNISEQYKLSIYRSPDKWKSLDKDLPNIHRVKTDHLAWNAVNTL
ncbi:unnamed protein product [Mytilus edulis]|uniref:Uncharacterized protein n=1 Tax=Mytilus edulis TaxID=6550 RepID=A0A8S3QC37_MYTED|nr:unnamed protein product [Mytilus edulis]